jgi:hypothetical protein
MAYEIEPGICRFCRKEPDLDKACFADPKATRCTKPGCVIAWERWRAMEIRQEQERLRLIRKIGSQFGRAKKYSRRRAA